MNPTKVIAIFDVGKTNKKLLLFDEQYKLVYEESKQLDEITDEDGFACEDVMALTQWMKDSFSKLLREKKFDINYKGAILLHKFYADFFVKDKIIVEIKSTKEGISNEYITQTLNYLKVSGCRLGLIINFGKSSLEYKRLIL